VIDSFIITGTERKINAPRRPDITLILDFRYKNTNKAVPRAKEKCIYLGIMSLPKARGTMYSRSRFIGKYENGSQGISNIPPC
jgi:hypothetical protein